MPEIQLPDIPGQWREQTFELSFTQLRLRLPAQPDLFLDDPEVLQANRRNDYMPYWSYLWPAAEPMARLLPKAPWPIGSEVLELGAGVGLVGLAAMARGDLVTFSDYDAKALVLCQFNARLNGFSLPQVWYFDWREFTSNRKFPVLLGCEVTYDAHQHEPLLNVIDQLMANDGVCWLGDPGRYQAPLFHQRAIARGYRVRILDESGQVHDSPRSNAFQILELRRR